MNRHLTNLFSAMGFGNACTPILPMIVQSFGTGWLATALDGRSTRQDARRGPTPS
ncbi:MAG: hypothetical protein MUE83_10065 [Tabrizicola sp.]|jgi:hypothetical protein|nr:hypothetical protein [Tabrizicola sp.]